MITFSNLDYFKYRVQLQYSTEEGPTASLTDMTSAEKTPQKITHLTGLPELLSTPGLSLEKAKELSQKYRFCVNEAHADATSQKIISLSFQVFEEVSPQPPVDVAISSSSGTQGQVHSQVFTGADPDVDPRYYAMQCSESWKKSPCLDVIAIVCDVDAWKKLKHVSTRLVDDRRNGTWMVTASMRKSDYITISHLSFVKRLTPTHKVRLLG